MRSCFSSTSQRAVQMQRGRTSKLTFLRVSLPFMEGQIVQSQGAADGSARIGTRRGRTLSVPAAFALFSAKRGKAWRSASMGDGGWFCVDWNDARENVERSGCFRAFLREERKSVAFCEYGGRRRFCADWNAAGENVEAGVPAVSMARRRIERLQGVQFCRRTMEIRSEVSRPPDWFRPAWLENWSVSSLPLSGFGRARATDECVCAFFRACSAPFRRNNPSARPSSTNEQSHGGLCPHPPRNLRFLGSSFRCRPLGRTIVPPRNAGASRDHRGAAPPPRTSPAPETHPSGQAPTTGAQTASPKRGSSCARPQPAVRTGRTRWR